MIRSALERFLTIAQVKIKKVNQNSKKVVQKSGPKPKNSKFWLKKRGFRDFFREDSKTTPNCPQMSQKLARDALRSLKAFIKNYIRKNKKLRIFVKMGKTEISAFLAESAHN